MLIARKNALRTIVFNELPYDNKEQLENKVVIALTGLTTDLDLNIDNYQRCLFIITRRPGMFPINNSLYVFIKHYATIHKNNFMFFFGR
jgi:hypothetical protein